jgi:hypothetical protein
MMQESNSAAPLEMGRGVPEHVAILGLGPSLSAYVELAKRLGGRRGYSDAVWGINALGDLIACDLIFHMDDMRVQEARAAANPQSNIAEMVRWLKTSAVPVMTSVARYPGHIAFPLEDVLNGGLDSNGGAPYFNSTAAYAVAYAVHIGVKRISLFGVDYTLPNYHSAEKGRACVEFWLGIAAARGIEITLPGQTSLMDACQTDRDRLYGYDCVDVSFKDDGGRLGVVMTERADPVDAAEIERRYDHNKHPNPLMRA